MKNVRALCLVSLWIGLVFMQAGIALADDKSPVNVINENGTIGDWLVVGPFPNPQMEKAATPGGATRAGFDKDFLEALGGETNAIIQRDTVVKYVDERGAQAAASACPAKAQGGIIDFHAFFPNMDYKVAYAFSYLSSPKDQTVSFYLGSDDCPKMWVNGAIVLDHWMGGRGLKARDDHFIVTLHKGLNPVLVKIEQGSGAWEFILEAFDEKGTEKIVAEEKLADTLRTFQKCELCPTSHWEFMFVPGAFPEIVWKDPCKVERLVGNFPLKARWFDKDLNEVSKADHPGRYMAYIEGDCPMGFKVRRALTFYCRPPDWKPWHDGIKAHIDYPPNSPFNAQAWAEREDAIARWAGWKLVNAMETEEDGAILASYLGEMIPAGKNLSPVDTPKIVNDDHHVALKRKLLGVEKKYAPLQMPKTAVTEATVLHAGSPREAGVKEDAAQRIRRVCEDWYQCTKEPFAVLVARKGVIVIHEAFGVRGDQKATTDTPFYIASIAKSLTGMMFAQFLDQGLIGLDDPVGKYLPDYPLTGDKAVTMRNCLTHTTGLEDDGLWCNAHDAWFDNIIANGLGYLKPGKVYIYNGLDYALAGKVMEVVGGKSVFRLIHEHLFVPLGLQQTRMDDLAGSSYSTAHDIAVLGQLLLNKGAYGNTVCFSPATFEQMLPRKLSEIYPGVQDEYGIGLSWMRSFDAKKGKNILGPRTFGHGASSGSVFRIDPDNELVVVLLRNSVGADYDQHLLDFLEAIEDGISGTM